MQGTAALPKDQRTTFLKNVSGPDVTQKMFGVSQPVWLHRYEHPEKKWVFCIGTLGEPGSEKFSLGGFRIVPQLRAETAGFSPDKEAVELACGMEEKVFWSKLTKIAGPLGAQHLDRIVGGKCVFLPTDDGRVGNPSDIPALNFALECLADFEATTRVFITTGQDLGHGILSDGVTSSLEYLNRRFSGSILADTSGPTAEGNFYVLKGMLRAVGKELPNSRIGLIGFGNIGRHLFDKLVSPHEKCAPSQISVIEANAAKREELSSRGVAVFTPAQKKEFLSLPLDAIAINANGGTLDMPTIEAITANPSIKVICGCENLVMPDHSGAEVLKKAQRLYSPMEFCGMMGYLTAVEEYFSVKQRTPFDMEGILQAASKMEKVSEAAAKTSIQSGFSLSFEEGLKRNKA